MLLNTPEITYSSLTDMMIEDEGKRINNNMVATQQQELQKKMQQQDRIKQRILETYQNQQQPTLEELANIQDKTEDASIMQSGKFELERMQKQAAILMQEGDIEGSNKIQDNIKDTRKTLSDYVENKRKILLEKQEQAAQIMRSVTDTPSYRAALNSVADIDPNIARAMLKKYGQNYNKEVATQLAADSAKYLKVKEQEDLRREDRDFEQEIKKYKSDLAQDAIENAQRNRTIQISRENLEQTKRRDRANIFDMLTKKQKEEKEDKLPISAVGALSTDETVIIKLLASELDLDFGSGSDLGKGKDAAMLRKAGSEAKIKSIKERIPYEQALREILMKPEETTSISTPPVQTGAPKVKFLGFE